MSKNDPEYETRFDFFHVGVARQLVKFLGVRKAHLLIDHAARLEDGAHTKNPGAPTEPPSK